MKTTWVVLLLGLCAIVGVFFACGGSSSSSGDDDQTGDDDNSPAADDDDNDDDDVSPGSLTVENVTQSACLNTGAAAAFDPTTDPIDVIQPSWDKGVLKIENLNAFANCGLKLAVEVASSGNTVTVTETGAGTAQNCMCPYNFNYEIHGIDIPGVTLVVQRKDLGAAAASEIFNLTIPLGSENKKWVVPLVDVFAAGDPTQKPFAANYAGCNFYHLADQLFMVRQDQGIYHVFSFDWFDLDDPGNYDHNCEMPKPVTIGTLASGQYHFGAPSYDMGGKTWSMQTFDVTIP